MGKQNKKGKGVALETALKNIEKQFGKGSIMRLDDSLSQECEVIKTGSIGLDKALGVGGLPRGRVAEIFGPESSGKTTMMLHAIAAAQREGGVAVFIDAEHALDISYAASLGVDVDNLLVSQPDTGEQALEILETLVASGAVDIAVVDSVAALTPKVEIEGEMGASHMGLQARLMSQALRKLVAVTKQTNTLVVFVNQIRSKIGVMFGSNETTTGGRALKFYSTVRLDIRRIGSIKDDQEVTGGKIKVKVVKNKIAAPFRTAVFDIMFGKGVSTESEILDHGIDSGAISKSGAWYNYGKVRLGQGRENAKKYLLENEETAIKIRSEIAQADSASDEVPECAVSKTTS